MSEKFCTVEDLYERNKELKKEDVLVLQEWLNKQSHLPKINEFLLISFLHACYYKIEPTKVCVENFYTLRTHWPEFSQNRDVFSKENQEALNITLVTPLPIHTKNDHLIIYTRMMDTNPDRYDQMAELRVFDIITWLWYLYLGSTPGQVLVMDMQGSSLSHLMKCNLVNMKKHMHYIQEALPVRLKGVHVINVSPMTDKMLTMVKPFLKKELNDLIHVHSKIDTLFEHVPRAALPKELGGEAGAFKELHERQNRLVEKNAQYILDSQKLITDESKRQGRSKNPSDIFGIEGTFKKLDID